MLEIQLQKDDVTAVSSALGVGEASCVITLREYKRRLGSAQLFDLCDGQCGVACGCSIGERTESWSSKVDNDVCSCTAKAGSSSSILCS